jgi:steroid Delta-isomerase
VAGDAENTIRRFWDMQDEGDYTKLVDLFHEDALIEDPIYGPMEGREAILAFMTKMVAVMAERGIHFEAIEIVGDDHAAWARWAMVAPEGRREGVGIYKVRDGRLTYYRDYMDPAEGGEATEGSA